jgi:ABC-type lipoprotein release transport system permease subunit
LLRSLLFGVSPLDPVVLILATAAILLLAAAASVLPAFRAASVNPVLLLRGE